MVMSDTSSLIYEKEDIPEGGLEVDIVEDPSTFALDDCSLRLKDFVKVQGRLTLAGNLIYFRGKVETSVVLPCARCLEHIDYPVEAAIRADFLPEDDSPKEEEIELESSDLDVYHYDRVKISLFEPVRDQIGISVPIKPLCSSNCAGLCPCCGQNRNKKKCGCSVPSGVDPRLAPLEKLKHLKEKL